MEGLCVEVEGVSLWRWRRCRCGVAAGTAAATLLPAFPVQEGANQRARCPQAGAIQEQVRRGRRQGGLGASCVERREVWGQVWAGVEPSSSPSHAPESWGPQVTCPLWLVTRDLVPHAPSYALLCTCVARLMGQFPKWAFPFLVHSVLLCLWPQQK